MEPHFDTLVDEKHEENLSEESLGASSGNGNKVENWFDKVEEA